MIEAKATVVKNGVRIQTLLDDYVITEPPCFIKERGCINCSVSRRREELTGFPYGFIHEGMIKCLMAAPYSVDISRPFLDPEEAVRMANEDGTREIIERTRQYCLYVKENFGVFYEKICVSIDSIIGKLKN